MRVLVDMNLSPAWVVYLLSQDIDAMHWGDIGRADASDREVMDWALRNDCLVMTADLDFSAILAASRGSKPSVLQIRADLLTPEALGSIVLKTLSNSRL